ncbi:hypothetical protein TRVL_07607 [Trypanosoma vivax]|nr:hypothetical protein TRVL_07607 [Trypanosoma vivax]
MEVETSKDRGTQPRAQPKRSKSGRANDESTEGNEDRKAQRRDHFEDRRGAIACNKVRIPTSIRGREHRHTRRKRQHGAIARGDVWRHGTVAPGRDKRRNLRALKKKRKRCPKATKTQLGAHSRTITHARRKDGTKTVGTEKRARLHVASRRGARGSTFEKRTRKKATWHTEIAPLRHKNTPGKRYKMTRLMHVARCRTTPKLGHTKQRGRGHEREDATRPPGRGEART